LNNRPEINHFTLFPLSFCSFHLLCCLWICLLLSSLAVELHSSSRLLLLLHIVSGATSSSLFPVHLWSYCLRSRQVSLLLILGISCLSLSATTSVIARPTCTCLRLRCIRNNCDGEQMQTYHKRNTLP